MKFHLLTAALFVGGILQAQTPLPAVYPQPQEVVLSNKSLILSPGQGITFAENSVKPDADVVRILSEVFPLKTQADAPSILLVKESFKEAPLNRVGAYAIFITQTNKKEIQIHAQDETGFFYAAQTLTQLATRDSSGNITLPTGNIIDYPDVAYRGTVEGFYGDPWSHADRIEQLRFYGRMKLNTYIYGPKDDPYHSSPNWRKPYPEKEAAQIRELTQEAAANKVNFVWAIHPGQDIQWTKEDRMNVLNKFEKMYELGVRSFAVFFDDISGEGAKADKQADLLNFLQKEFVKKKTDVHPLIMCPTEYNRAWAGSDYLDVLGRTLDPSIQIMWTGNSVVADITREGLEWVNRRIQRPAYVWWNFPVSDYCRDHLLMGPAYGLDSNVTGAMSGFVSNPMERAEASKVALFGVAGYAWNLQAYSPEKSFDAACRYLLPEAPEAFRTFCENNCDPGANGHRYRREESARYADTAETFLKAYREQNYDKDAAAAMNQLFAEIAAAPEAIKQSKNKALIDELSPWLMQFRLLGMAGQEAIALTRIEKTGNRAATWQAYLALASRLNQMRIVDWSQNQNPYQPGVKTGSRILTPFVQEIFAQSGRRLLFTDAAETTSARTGQAAILTDVEQLKYQPLKEGKNQIGYNRLNEVLRIEPGQFFGLSWELQKEATAFQFNLPKSGNLSGRMFEWSADGNTWQPLKGIPADKSQFTLEKVPSQARCIRMRNTSDKQMQINLNLFAVTTKEDTSIDPARLMYDKNLESANRVAAGAQLTFERSNPAASLELFLSGMPNSRVVIKGNSSRNGTEQTFYAGPAGYILLNAEWLGNIEKLVLQNVGDAEIHIHEIQ